MTTEPIDIHDLIEDLTRTHSHREPYVIREGTTTWTKGHVTLVPALVHQLVGATPAGSGSESGATAAKSKPAARIESIDTLMLIDDEATRWLARLRVDDPNERLDPRTRLPIEGQRATTGHATIAVLNRLHGAHASQDTKTQHAIERDVRRWWHQARIVSGWDSPAYRPFNTCLVCEQRGGLRINLATSSAMCIECRTVWAPEDIGLLAEHIRAENLEDQTEDDQERSA